MAKSSYENLQKKVRSLKTPAIESWKNQYPDREYTIDLTIPEFTCVCPKTGQPDFATLYLSYAPGNKCVELKSFKMYMNFYRGIGIFHEHAVNKILDDFVKACAPRRAHLTGDFNMRGGIHTVVTAGYDVEKGMTVA